jgi:hypothetical protein
MRTIEVATEIFEGGFASQHLSILPQQQGGPYCELYAM